MSAVLPNDEIQLLTISDFAARLGISVWTARAWAYSGRISSVKLGYRLQVPASEIARLVSEGMRPRVQSPKLPRKRCQGDVAEVEAR